MAIRCLSPPDSSVGLRALKSESPTRANAPSTRSRCCGSSFKSGHFDDATKTLSFRVTDGRSTANVTTQSIPTALFRDGVAVVLAGRLTQPGQFAAEELVVKHSEVYAPLAPGQTVPPGILGGQGSPP